MTEMGAPLTPLLEAAIAYAAKGWPVLPLHSPGSDGSCSCGTAGCQSIGKHPHTDHGLKDGSTDEATIRGWWAKWPDANVGVLTGRASGVVALDVDPRHGGDESLAELEDRFGLLPRTLMIGTGGGGCHLYFARPSEVVRSRSGFRAGLDFKADGGYVVAPPSLHASGSPYLVQTPGVALAPMPAWLINLVGAAPPVAAGGGAGGSAGELAEGQRNSNLTSIAGSMRRRDLSPAAIEAALLAENAARCDPPLSEEEVRSIVGSVLRYPARHQSAEHETAPGGGEKRQAQADRLVALAADAEFFRTPEGDPFATVPVGDHHETWSLGSREFHEWITARYFETEHKVPRRPTVEDALGTLKGKARFGGSVHRVHVRLAEHGGSIYLDLANERCEAIKVTPEDWTVITDPPVKFRRPSGMLPLPIPARGGSLTELRRFINASDDDYVLMVGWVLAALRPRGPYPILAIHGEQGSGKSTGARVLRALVDPSVAMLRAEPREVRDLMITASNSWIQAFDNLSQITPGLSDAFCRLSTGGGFATRALYSDDAEKIFDVKCPVLLNGIEELATREDLLDRALTVCLSAIPAELVRDEEDFWRDFEEAHPRILGALLDAVSTALRNLPSTRLVRLPRMADFAKWVTAAEPALGWAPGTILRAYAGNRACTVDLVIESSPVATALMELVRGEPQVWVGTATDLLCRLNGIADDATRNSKAWPKEVRPLTNSIRRLASHLRRAGVEVVFLPRRGQARLIQVGRAGFAASPASLIGGTSQIAMALGSVSDDASPVAGDAMGCRLMEPGPPASPPAPEQDGAW